MKINPRKAKRMLGVRVPPEVYKSLEERASLSGKRLGTYAGEILSRHVARLGDLAPAEKSA